MSLAHESSPAVLRLDANAFRTPELTQAPFAFRHILRGLAKNWIAGDITWVMPSGRALHLKGHTPGPSARIVVKDPRFMRRVLSAGVIGFAEGYMADEWDSPDLPVLLEAFSLNLGRIEALLGKNPVVVAFNHVRHLLRANTRRGSRQNIHAHYDLGNAFYERWLDRTMTYSSALYEYPKQPLPDAQRRKYQALAQAMDLRPGQHVLEIGCGWGGFAEYAAKDLGAQVTAITISEQQYGYARRRMFEQGLAERADVRMLDYRDVEGRFDRIASIEMFEAVGERWWPTYFRKVRDLLTPTGRAGLQIITIHDDLFEGYKHSSDFIQKYIFPGGMLPSEAKLRDQTARAGLSWTGVRRFGEHYADTLLEWLREFDAAWSAVRQLGFDEKFRRVWRFYLAYCEAGFRTARTDVIQLALAKT